LIIGISASARSEPSFSTWNSAESQVRHSERGGRQAQFNLFDHSSLAGLPRSTELRDYFQYSRNWNPGGNLYYLYDASLQPRELTKSLSTILGRQTIVRGTLEGILDGATIRLSPGDHTFYVDAFGGLTRTVETGQFTYTPGIMAGLQGGWRPNNDTQLTVMTAYSQVSYKNSAWKTSGTQLLGLSGHIRLGETRQWRLYTDTTFDVAGRILPLASIGVAWQVTPLLSVALNGSRYDVNRNAAQTTIMSLFTTSSLWLARFGATYYISPDIQLFANYDFQTSRNAGQRRYGSVVEGGVDMNFRKVKLGGRALYRFIDSFGGQDNDIWLTLNQRPWEFLVFDGFANYSKYKKITNNNGYALATGVGVTYEPRKWVGLRVGGEFMRNNIFAQDWRIDSSLVIRWDKM
jgi:hypothetical protein